MLLYFRHLCPGTSKGSSFAVPTSRIVGLPKAQAKPISRKTLAFAPSRRAIMPLAVRPRFHSVTMSPTNDCHHFLADDTDGAAGVMDRNIADIAIFVGIRHRDKEMRFPSQLHRRTATSRTALFSVTPGQFERAECAPQSRRISATIGSSSLARRLARCPLISTIAISSRPGGARLAPRASLKPAISDRNDFVHRARSRAQKRGAYPRDPAAVTRQIQCAHRERAIRHIETMQRSDAKKENLASLDVPAAHDAWSPSCR